MTMKMIERTPHRGDEIQLFELTPDEVRHYNRRDNRTRRRAIVKCALKRIFSILFP